MKFCTCKSIDLTFLVKCLPLVAASKTLYGATQLASMLGNATSSGESVVPDGRGTNHSVATPKIKTEQDLFSDSHGHFDSFLRDLSEHDMSAPKSKPKERYVNTF